MARLLLRRLRPSDGCAEKTTSSAVLVMRIRNTLLMVDPVPPAALLLPGNQRQRGPIAGGQGSSDARIAAGRTVGGRMRPSAYPRLPNHDSPTDLRRAVKSGLSEANAICPCRQARSCDALDPNCIYPDRRL